jgi:hypothetical protein
MTHSSLLRVSLSLTARERKYEEREREREGYTVHVWE